MATVEIEHSTLEAIQMLMRLIGRMDDHFPGVALVKTQAQAVEEKLEENAQAQS